MDKEVIENRLDDFLRTYNKNEVNILDFMTASVISIDNYPNVLQYFLESPYFDVIDNSIIKIKTLKTLKTNLIDLKNSISKIVDDVIYFISNDNYNGSGIIEVDTGVFINFGKEKVCVIYPTVDMLKRNINILTNITFGGYKDSIKILLKGNKLSIKKGDVIAYGVVQIKDKL